ncbi:NAD(P)/FAD-dependent oxidoreductase [Candidatus Nomurabacteria bacterium]|nr:NAD(P)/FAD-dependent oxidoreductase [Candidatus Nomurabacteria bacterium]
MKKKRIVILGAGFGGIYTFKYLHKKFHNDSRVELVLINRENYFLFTPLLHEVATGSVSPEHIIHPIRVSLGCCLSEFHEANILSVKTKTKTVNTSVGDIAYDYLVVALGAKTNYFGMPELKENTLALKTLEDAFSIKNQIIETLEKANQSDDKLEREKLLRYVVIGGGPAGVELATEISDFIYGTFRHYFSKSLIDQVDIQLLQAIDVILPGFSPFIQNEAEKVLKKEKVALKKNCMVSSVQGGVIEIKEADPIEAGTVIWTAGVAANTLPFDIDIELSKGRIPVENDFQVKGLEDVFALGDIADFQQDGASLPPLAQVAVVQAKTLAYNISAQIEGKPKKGFHFQSKGSLVSLGKFRAAGVIGPLKLRGPLMWWLWRTVYVTKLLTWKQRFRVVLDWTIGLFTRRDISKFQ